MLFDGVTDEVMDGAMELLVVEIDTPTKRMDDCIATLCYYLRKIVEDINNHPRG